MVESVTGAIRAIGTDAVAARKEQSENPTAPDLATDVHDASAKLFNDLTADLRQFHNSSKLVKGAVEAFVDSDLIADLGYHPNMKVSTSPGEIDFTDPKTKIVVAVTPEGVTTKPNVWELAQLRLKSSGINPTRDRVIDECMHILNTKYMRENGSLWGVASKDLRDQGIENPTGPQITAEVNRLAKKSGITDPDVVRFLQPIDITPDSVPRRK